MVAASASEGSIGTEHREQLNFTLYPTRREEESIFNRPSQHCNSPDAAHTGDIDCHRATHTKLSEAEKIIHPVLVAFQDGAMQLKASYSSTGAQRLARLEALQEDGMPVLKSLMTSDPFPP